MIDFTAGAARELIAPEDVDSLRASGALIEDVRRERPRYFDGRFLAARDLIRDQQYFLAREADLGQASGGGVTVGLRVALGQAADELVVSRGYGVTPAGELTLLPQDLTVRLADIPLAEQLSARFALSRRPQPPLRNRTGLFVLALRPVEFTANPVGAYPTSITGQRTVEDGDVIEATAVVLVPWTDDNATDALDARRGRAARAIFVENRPSGVSANVLPLAMVALQNNVVVWLDVAMARRELGADFADRPGLGVGGRALRLAYLLQYYGHLEDELRHNGGRGFPAVPRFSALPPAGPMPPGMISTRDFTQNFFPAEIDAELAPIPEDELPAMVDEALGLPAVDLTVPPALLELDRHAGAGARAARRVDCRQQSAEPDGQHAGDAPAPAGCRQSPRRAQAARDPAAPAPAVAAAGAGRHQRPGAAGVGAPRHLAEPVVRAPAQPGVSRRSRGTLRALRRPRRRGRGQRARAARTHGAAPTIRRAGRARAAQRRRRSDGVARQPTLCHLARAHRRRPRGLDPHRPARSCIGARRVGALDRVRRGRRLAPPRAQPGRRADLARGAEQNRRDARLAQHRRGGARREREHRADARRVLGRPAGLDRAKCADGPRTNPSRTNASSTSARRTWAGHHRARNTDAVTRDTSANGTHGADAGDAHDSADDRADRAATHSDNAGVTHRDNAGFTGTDHAHGPAAYRDGTGFARRDVARFTHARRDGAAFTQSHRHGAHHTDTHRDADRNDKADSHHPRCTNARGHDRALGAALGGGAEGRSSEEAEVGLEEEAHRKAQAQP